jgi:AhpD family alkylhydroperoxidase
VVNDFADRDAIAASIVGKCKQCVSSHIDGLRKLAVTSEQLREIGRIATVVQASTFVQQSGTGAPVSEQALPLAAQSTLLHLGSIDRSPNGWWLILSSPEIPVDLWTYAARTAASWPASSTFFTARYHSLCRRS